jgi:5-methylcytosine-specific restriction endonuclease McrA
LIQFRWLAKEADWVNHRSVMARDGWSCQARRPDGSVCGSTQDLTIHHLVPQRLDPTRRTDPKNEITLCRRCHDEEERRRRRRRRTIR